MSDLFVDNIKHQSSQGSGTITIGASGEKIDLGATAGGTLTARPAFEAYLSATQSASDTVTTKVQVDTEIYDTDNCYDNSTNYRFTPTVAGKYVVYARVRVQTAGDSALERAFCIMKKNGSTQHVSTFIDTNNEGRTDSPQIMHVVDMNGTTDYVELFAAIYANSTIDGFVGSSLTRHTVFGAYRLIGV